MDGILLLAVLFLVAGVIAVPIANFIGCHCDQQINFQSWGIAFVFVLFYSYMCTRVKLHAKIILRTYGTAFRFFCAFTASKYPLLSMLISNAMLNRRASACRTESPTYVEFD